MLSMSTTSNNTVLPRSASKRGSIEKPRPLHKSTVGSPLNNHGAGASLSKLSSFELSSVENTMSLLDNVALKLGNGVYDSTLTNAILNLSASLKSWGPFIEVKYKEKFDKCQVALRCACRDEKLAMVARLHLLEIFELRAMNWKATESMTNYYKQKIAQVERESQSLASKKSSTSSTPSNSSGATTTTTVNSSNESSASSRGSRSVSSSPILKAAAAPLSSSTPLNGLKKKQVSGGVPSKEIQVSIYVGDQEIKLSGFDSGILEVAESVLQRHFKKVGGSKHHHQQPPRVNNNALQRSKSVLCDSHVNVIRSPLLPDSSKGALHEESELLLMNRETRDRRAQFARNRSKTTLSGTKDAPLSGSSRVDGAYQKNRFQYDRKQLLEISRSEICQQAPKNWGHVKSIMPEIALDKAHGSPLALDWEANFLFSKKPQYSEHCDREGKNVQKFVRDSRA